MATFFRQIIWLIQFKDLHLQKNRDMKKWQKKAIKEIMHNFDFKKVRKTMLALDWRWNSINRTPFVSELMETAEQLLFDSTVATADDSGVYYVSTGGLEVICDKVRKGMRLVFIVSDWEVLKDGE